MSALGTTLPQSFVQSLLVKMLRVVFVSVVAQKPPSSVQHSSYHGGPCYWSWWGLQLSLIQVWYPVFLSTWAWATFSCRQAWEKDFTVHDTCKKTKPCSMSWIIVADFNRDVSVVSSSTVSLLLRVTYTFNCSCQSKWLIAFLHHTVLYMHCVVICDRVQQHDCFETQ